MHEVDASLLPANPFVISGSAHVNYLVYDLWQRTEHAKGLLQAAVHQFQVRCGRSHKYACSEDGPSEFNGAYSQESVHSLQLSVEKKTLLNLVEIISEQTYRESRGFVSQNALIQCPLQSNLLPLWEKM